jgi:predicted enzyme related to lactoylglutathione lyase
MQNEHVLTQGDFCWTELSTPNLNASKNFYQEIFSWNYADHTMPAGVYSMMRLGEQELGGAYEITDEMKSHGIPSVWHAYVLVDDVVKMAEKAKQLGAHIICEPLEVMEMGKMAVFSDPTGAVISIWQTNGQPGKALDKNKHGATTCF